MPISTYDDAMHRARELAERGPRTGENPQVGCVLVDDTGAIVAEGWHRGAGTTHAEVDALSKVESARGLTAVVTLEPCNHTGRTGPCTQALIEAGVSRVVYSLDDPGQESSGGAQTLRAAGIDVVSGVLSGEGYHLVERWLTANRLGRPWVTAKWGSSLDGRTAATDGTSQWITSAESRTYIHLLRSQHDTIAIGTGTAIADNPSLTARTADGNLFPNQPLAVVIGDTPLPDGSGLWSHPRGVLQESGKLVDILERLYNIGIRSLFLEGGPRLMNSFIREGLVDEYVVCLAPILLGGDKTATSDLGIGTLTDARRLNVTSTEIMGGTIVVTAREAH
ncbi:MAG: riboflavin-specific deaminase [Actinomycetota bacterium]|jgi:diaminohydroxyphosphoribosylaminopyrimidine deaminase/5-amino-6-(5-phosphoribosylamino)uracil reductase